MKILMLGNSLTTANNLPDLIGQKLNAEVIVHAKSGARLSEHLNPNTAMGKLTLSALSNDQFDYVILQEMSKAPAVNTEAFLKSVSGLSGLIRKNGAIHIFYATWAYRNGSARLTSTKMTYDEMYSKMHSAYLKAAKDNNALIADVCKAFYEYPNNEILYANDGVHPSVIGTNLVSECIIAAINNHKGV